LYHANDELVPKFFEALKENRQQFIADFLGNSDDFLARI